MRTSGFPPAGTDCERDQGEGGVLDQTAAVLVSESGWANGTASKFSLKSGSTGWAHVPWTQGDEAHSSVAVKQRGGVLFEKYTLPFLFLYSIEHNEERQNGIFMSGR